MYDGNIARLWKSPAGLRSRAGREERLERAKPKPDFLFRTSVILLLAAGISIQTHTTSRSAPRSWNLNSSSLVSPVKLERKGRKGADLDVVCVCYVWFMLSQDNRRKNLALKRWTSLAMVHNLVSYSRLCSQPMRGVSTRDMQGCYLLYSSLPKLVVITLLL